MILLAVPGTAGGRAQAGHDLEQVAYGRIVFHGDSTGQEYWIAKYMSAILEIVTSATASPAVGWGRREQSVPAEIQKFIIIGAHATLQCARVAALRIQIAYLFP